MFVMFLMALRRSSVFLTVMISPNDSPCTTRTTKKPLDVPIGNTLSKKTF